MSLSDAIEVVRAVLPERTSARKLRAQAVIYLNWWNGNSEVMQYADPTGEKAVRRILAQHAALA